VTLNAVKKTASALSVELFEVPARSPLEFEGAFAVRGAKALGLPAQPSLVLRADQVIE
jgi:hypothetical protein